MTGLTAPAAVPRHRRSHAPAAVQSPASLEDQRMKGNPSGGKRNPATAQGSQPLADQDCRIPAEFHQCRLLSHGPSSKRIDLSIEVL